MATIGNTSDESCTVERQAHQTLGGLSALGGGDFNASVLDVSEAYR